jgi:hypothetical protein
MYVTMESSNLLKPMMQISCFYVVQRIKFIEFMQV